MTFKQIKRTDTFEKDLKGLKKRFRTLPEDLETFISAQLKLFHKLNIDNKGIKQIPNLDKTFPPIYKARKFACKSLKGKGAQSGIRVIYAYYEEEDRIDFIQIYFKSDRSNHDSERINEYLKDRE